MGTAAASAADARTSVVIGKNGRPDARAFYNGTRGGLARTQARSGRYASAEALAIAQDHDGSMALSYSRIESSPNHHYHERTDVVVRGRNYGAITVGDSTSVSITRSNNRSVSITGSNNVVMIGLYVYISELSFDEEEGD
jgi:hypothetical protein